MCVSKPVTRSTGASRLYRHSSDRRAAISAPIAGGFRRLVDDDATAGLGHRLGDGVEVQRGQRGDVDDFGADAFLGQFVGGFEAFLHLRAPGHQGHVGTVAQHEADVERQRFAVVGYLFLVLAIDALRLEEHHRIRVADRGEQQAVGTRRRGGHDHAQAGDVGEQVLVRLGVMLRCADAAAPRGAPYGRNGHAAAGAIAQARGVAGDLFHHRVDEAFELRFGDRLHALHGQADGDAGDGGFVQRRVEHAPFAEFFLQALGGAEHAAVDANVFAEDDDAFVVRHFVGERLGHGFDKSDLCHGGESFSAYDWRSRLATSSRWPTRSAGSSAYR